MSTVQARKVEPVFNFDRFTLDATTGRVVLVIERRVEGEHELRSRGGDEVHPHRDHGGLTVAL